MGSGWLPRPPECQSSAAQPPNPAQPRPTREQSGEKDRRAKRPEGLMQGDGVLARGGQKDPTDEDARGSRKKSYFVPALKGADPQIRPRSLTFPSRPAGGPAGPARSLAPWTVAPTAPPLFLLLFQGRLGASRRKSRPSPLPPTGSGAEGLSRQRS